MSLIDLQPTYDERRAPRRSRVRNGLMVWLGVGAFLLFAAHANHNALLVNVSPSEPEGLYLRVHGVKVRRGALVAFLAPAAAFPYADRQMGFLHRTPILKAVGAIAGDYVCASGGELWINGNRRAKIAATDRNGQALPRWLGCRRLAAGEVFAFSDRVPNSFDSRYFGPMAARVTTPYLPLATVNGIGW
jgi:conjugative transfer signal peptidase TraF